MVAKNKEGRRPCNWLTEEIVGGWDHLSLATCTKEAHRSVRAGPRKSKKSKEKGERTGEGREEMGNGSAHADEQPWKWNRDFPDSH